MKKRRQNWSKKEIGKIVGQSQETYLAHAKSKRIRKLAASGGVATALIIRALKDKKIDGAILCRSIIKDGKVRTEFFIAKYEKDVLRSQGSKYVSTDFLKEVKPLITNFKGKIAIVGLPCDISNIKKHLQGNPKIFKKIVFTIALFCGHNSQPQLIDNVVKKLEKEAGSKIKEFKFRVGHWRGKARAKFKNNKILLKKSSILLLYQNMYLFSERKCLSCYDHFGYSADISLGDVWSYSLKSNPIKQSGVIIRTTVGSKVFKQVVKNEDISTKKVDKAVILDGQKRGAPFHYNVSARNMAGKLFGVVIPDRVYRKVNIFNFLAAFIVLMNWKWSQNKSLAKLIFIIPKPLMQINLYILKGLQSLK